MPDDVPVLYSFRRCPYAMRARLAIAASGQTCALREVVLRNKPPEMIAVSPKGTVPVIVLPDTEVIEESLEIMRWALDRHDPEGWLVPSDLDRDDIDALIAENDGPFKDALDRYKYPTRYENTDPLDHRTQGEAFLKKLNARLLAPRSSRRSASSTSRCATRTSSSCWAGRGRSTRPSCTW